jgi:uncharacterized protein YodC (DUF2158 family)
MPENFKVGDVVRLKSGGPNMTIGEIGDTGVYCQWFAGDKPSASLFDSETLVKVEETPNRRG